MRPKSQRDLPLLEWIPVMLSIATALWILLTSVNIARAGWVAIPTADDWDRWITYVREQYSLAWFFEVHVDHRLAAPKVLFVIDHLAFHARGWFLLVCSFIFQALTGIMLWWLAGRICRQSRTERLMQAAFIACCVFSGQQWINFIWPFQVVFPLIYCASAAALFALYKGSLRPDDTRWIAAGIAAAAVATYTMANGVLLWPVLLLTALWLRMPRRWMVALTAGTLLIGATYFYHWHQSSPYAPKPPLEKLRRIAIFGLAHLGAPTVTIESLRNGELFRVTFAMVVGTLLALALLIAFAQLWRRRERYHSAYAVLLCYCLFIAGTSVTMAYGRSDGPLIEVFTPRYLTPAYILWAAMLLVFWPLLRRMNHLALYCTLCAAMYLGVAIHQGKILNIVRDRTSIVHLGETAVIDNVTDPDPWVLLFYAPQLTTDATRYLKANHLAIFTEEWTHWPGIPLRQRFAIDPNRNACQGQFEPTVAVPSTFKPGWRVTGWAWDDKTARSPRYIVLADDQGQVAGVALTGFPPSHPLAGPSSQAAASTWNGYVNGQPRPITAYVLEADDRSLCSIGTQPLYRPGTAPEALAAAAGMPFPPGISRNLTPNDMPTLCVLDNIGPVSDPAAQTSVHVSGDPSFAIMGWAVDEPRRMLAGGVDVVLDQAPYSAKYGFSRLDVADHFHNPTYGESGFRLVLPPHQLPKGRHSVSIRVIANDRKSYYQGPVVPFTVD